MSNLDVNVVDERRRKRGLGVVPRPRRSNPHQRAPENSADRGASKRHPRSSRGAILGVGAEPRVDLLPAEVHAEQRARATARRAWLAVVVLGVLVVLASGVATAERMNARAALDQAQADGASVLQEQLRFGEVRSVQRQTDLLRAAQAVGGSSQIDWDTVLGTVSQVLPSGTTIAGLTVTSMDPVKGFTQSSEPLAPSRVATVEITISSTAVPSVPDLSDRLAKVPGYVDAGITAISGAGDSGQYTGQITLDLGTDAFDKTYTYKKED